MVEDQEKPSGPFFTQLTTDPNNQGGHTFIPPAGEGHGRYTSGSVINIGVLSSLENIANADPGDIQKIAASQIKLLIAYYDSVLDQAKKSFRWALGASIIGIVFFFAAVVIFMVTNIQGIATISVISGAIVEVIAGLNFYLYGKTTSQLADFHQRLDQTQRFLLANSICEALKGDIQQETRSKLVLSIIGIDLSKSNIDVDNKTKAEGQNSKTSN
jgi:hypothetical protein